MILDDEEVVVSRGEERAVILDEWRTREFFASHKRHCNCLPGVHSIYNLLYVGRVTSCFGMDWNPLLSSIKLK
jgi:hypothetical protein